MTDIVDRLRDRRERFVFQGGRKFAVGLADRIDELEAQLAEARTYEQDAKRWREFWSAINGERVSYWCVTAGFPEMRLSPDLVLERIDAALADSAEGR